MSTLRVTNIQNPSGTTAMIIGEDNGVVSQPAKPYWVLGVTSSGQVEGDIAFDNEHAVRGVTHSGGNITILTAGLYLCTFMTNADGTATYKYIRKNGTQMYNPMTQWHNGADSNTLILPIDCAVNDVLDCYHHTAGNGTWGHNTLFTGVLL
tara:strand:- start:15063 stop:15515 length:453 start_codon:yes stop_codon:yes gene_type:complete